MNAYGKHTKRLAKFASEITDEKAKERRHTSERDLDRVRLRDLKDERREAIVRQELGDPHRPLDEIDAEICEAAVAVDRDEPGARAEAARRKVGRLEGERDAYAREHAAELFAEIVPAAAARAEEVLRRMGELADAVDARAQVAQDLSSIVRLMPPPEATSTYRLFVPEDRVGAILRGAITNARSLGVVPLVPQEFTAAAAGEDDDEVEGPTIDHATGARVA